jgi:hypothetical protein
MIISSRYTLHDSRISFKNIKLFYDVLLSVFKLSRAVFCLFYIGRRVITDDLAAD